MKDWSKAPLEPKERNAIQSAVNLLKLKFPIDKVILFGSKARGHDDRYSDIDLLLICSTALNWKDEKAVIDLLFDTGMKYDVIFSPLFATNKEWGGGIFTSFPIYREIMKDGAIVI